MDLFCPLINSQIWFSASLNSFFMGVRQILKILKTISCVMSLRLSAWNNFAPTGRIFLKFVIWLFFVNLSRNFKFHWNLTRIMGTLYEDLRMYICGSRLLNSSKSEKRFRQNCRKKKTQMLFSATFSQNRAVYETTWKNIVELDRPQVKT
jgi:hypothetical protein